MLDAKAKSYWDAARDSANQLDGEEAEFIARWATKVLYNAQRAVRALGSAGEEPPLPEELRRWVLDGGTRPPCIALSIARMPTGHRDFDGAGVFGSNGTKLPRRYLQLRGVVVFLAWDPPGMKDVASKLSEYDRGRAPAVELSGSKDAIEVPVLKDPDMVRRGFWSNPELLKRMAERFPPDEA